jgi:ABC-type bacteriocin/lantibiotic exporter with double-glycine peptidase domain
MSTVAELITQTVQVIVSNNRLKQFLVSDELSDYVDKNPSDDFSNFFTKKSFQKNLELEDIIEVSDATMTWDKSDPQTTLQNINLSASKASLIAIVGKVGSGKSSFLLSLLGNCLHMKSDMHGGRGVQIGILRL